MAAQGTDTGTDGAIEAAPRSRRPRELALRVAYVLGVTVGVVLFARTLDRRAVLSALSGASPAPLVLAALLGVVSVAMKAGFWSAALSPFVAIEASSVFVYTLASGAASLLAPFRAGEALRLWILRRAHGVPLATSLSVVALEKVADLSWLLVLLAPLPWLGVELPSGALRVLAWAPALPFVFVALLFLASRSSRLRASAFLSGLRLARHPRALVRALLFVGAAWVLDVLMITLCLSSVGAGASLGRALVVLLFVNVASSVPVTPGAAGTHELASVSALTWTGISHEHAAAFALLYHAVQTLPTLALGLAVSRRASRALATPPAPDAQALGDPS